jgi:arginine-tRNA-protein transferase
VGIARALAGDRRTGGYLYRPECPSCRACQALRVDVGGFRPSRTQQRVHRKGDRAFRLDIVSPEADDTHTNLFNQHRLERGLSSDRISTTDYRQFLVATCCQTVELQFHCADKLVAVSIADRGHGALSAVYCYFDPSYSQYSPGTYAILKQLELCRLWNLQYLYLGLYIASNPHMSYKNRFHPHERLIEGKWVRFE